MTPPVLLSPDDLLTITVTADDPVRVRVAGEVDTMACPRLTDALAGAIELGTGVVVDLSAVTFLGVAGVRALASAHGSAAATSIPLHVCGCSPTVLAAIQLGQRLLVPGAVRAAAGRAA